MAKIKGFTVALERDINEEDFQRIKDAVEMTKGVLQVQPAFATGQDCIIRMRLKNDITRNILKLIDETE